MNSYAEAIKNKKTAVVYGYAYALNTMAEYLNRAGKHTFPDLKGVVSTAELLTDSARAKIEKAFGVRVFDQYGCNESGISAFECEHKTKHLISTRVMYETDANGCLVSTDLFNDGFIMLKYNTTDIVVFSDKQCRCKRSYPVIEEVTGRTNDVVIDMNNKVFHASFFGIVLSKDDSIHQYQVTFDHDSILLNIHSEQHNEKYFADLYIPRIQKYVKFDSYKVVMNQPFEKTPNGKHREVVDKRKVKPKVFTE
jgi:phenylacetate-CoA ligase